MEVLPNPSKGGFSQVIYPDELFEDAPLCERVLAELAVPDSEHQPARAAIGCFRSRGLPKMSIRCCHCPPSSSIRRTDNAADRLFQKIPGP